MLCRETSSIEHHTAALIHLLESCLKYPVTPANKDDEPPHAKIASDILSCVFLVSDLYTVSAKIHVSTSEMDEVLVRSQLRL